MFYNMNRRIILTVLKPFRPNRSISFVPQYEPPGEQDLERLEDFVKNSKQLLVLTGAGVSTESGIPDYRSEVVGLYARSNHKPIQYQEFVKSAETRQRYWARNFVGWLRFSSVRPNETHYAIRELECVGKLSRVITQNVDNLHQKAGSVNALNLHGTAFQVICLKCDYETSRHNYQDVLADMNPHMESSFGTIRPDGDVELTADQVNNFKVKHCPKCEGPLKPDIVFFGDNLPRQRIEEVRKEVSRSDSILILGSTLATYSSYRIILQAKEEKKEIVIVNIGPTRADSHVNFKVSTKCGDVIPSICRSII